MTEYTEDDITYMSGYLDGYLRACELLIPGNQSFDAERWEALYGMDVAYNTFPGYANDADARAGQNPLGLMDWDSDREIAVLKDGVDLPVDRSGTLVFVDGTVVTKRTGERQMFTVPGSVVDSIQALRDTRLEMVRDVYDYDPDAREL